MGFLGGGIHCDHLLAFLERLQRLLGLRELALGALELAFDKAQVAPGRGDLIGLLILLQGLDVGIGDLRGQTGPMSSHGDPNLALLARVDTQPGAPFRDGRSLVPDGEFLLGKSEVALHHLAQTARLQKGHGLHTRPTGGLPSQA